MSTQTHTPGKKCFTCGKEATHISTRITPAGYFSYQCSEHAIDQTKLWGSDPGWQTIYTPLAKAEGRG